MEKHSNSEPRPQDEPTQEDLIRSLQLRQMNMLDDAGVLVKLIQGIQTSQQLSEDNIIAIRNSLPVVIGEDTKDGLTLSISYKTMRPTPEGSYTIESIIVPVGSKRNYTAHPNATLGLTVADFITVLQLYEEVKAFKKEIAPNYSIEHGDLISR